MGMTQKHLKSLPVTKEVLELNGFKQCDHDDYLTNGYTHIRIASDDTAEVFDYSVEGEDITICQLYSVFELDLFMKLREREEWQLKLPNSK